MESPVLDVKKLKVAELTVELKKRRRGVGGDKDFLIARLTAAMDANVPVSVAPREPGMGGLVVTARWELLSHNPTSIPEPINTDDTIRPPNVRFVQDEFLGKINKMKYMNEHACNRRKKNGRASSGKDQPAPNVNHRVRGGKL